VVYISLFYNSCFFTVGFEIDIYCSVSFFLPFIVGVTAYRRGVYSLAFGI
jgi:hypothetical protein